MEDDEAIRYALFDRILEEEGGRIVDLAARVEMSVSRLSNWKTRIGPPPTSALRTICEKTGRRLVLEIIPPGAARTVAVNEFESTVIDLLRKLRAVDADEYERAAELIPADLQSVIAFAERRVGRGKSDTRSGSDRTS